MVFWEVIEFLLNSEAKERAAKVLLATEVTVNPSHQTCSILSNVKA